MTDEMPNNDQLADLSSLGTDANTAQPTEQVSEVQQETKAFGEFINSTLGFVAAVGLPAPEFESKAQEFKQTAEYLQIGQNFTKITSLQNVSPGQALIAGVVLFAATVVITRPDLQAGIKNKLFGKKEQKKQQQLESKEVGANKGIVKRDLSGEIRDDEITALHSEVG